MANSLGAAFLVIMMLSVGAAHANMTPGANLMDLLEEKSTRIKLMEWYDWCRCVAPADICRQEADEVISKIDPTNRNLNLTWFDDYVLNLNVTGSECVHDMGPFKFRGKTNTPTPQLKDATTGGTTPTTGGTTPTTGGTTPNTGGTTPTTGGTTPTTAGTTTTTAEPASNITKQNITPTPPGPADSKDPSSIEGPAVTGTSSTLIPIPVSTTVPPSSSNSTGSSSKPTTGTVDSESGTSPLYWVIPVLAVVLVAMLIGGIYIHRYAKKAGFRQSSKAESTKINVSNSCNEGV